MKIIPETRRAYYNILKLSLGRFLWNLFQDTQNSLNFFFIS